MLTRDNRSELTPSQRLVKLYQKLEAGAIIEPTPYAREIGITRQAVHHQFDQLSGMGVDIIRIAEGKWCLARYSEKYQSWIDEG
jgi:biotin operon repressor